MYYSQKIKTSINHNIYSLQISISLTVKTVTLGGFNLKPIFDDRKLKNHIFVSFSPHRNNPSIMMGSFCRHASRLVVCESTSCCRKFTVRFIAVDHLGNDRQPNQGLRPV